jgi:UDP:flavonoid glycosyltransferase YjiC (YdhE family)
VLACCGSRSSLSSSVAAAKNGAAERSVARILYAWELGGGLGHLAHARAVGEPLVKAGHELVFVLRNPLPAVRVLGTLGRFLAAPIWPPLPRAKPVEVFSYPSLLASVGYRDEEALFTLALAWRHTIELVKPDAVFADHAPTALVALKALGIPTVVLGSGFFVPPARFPMPHLKPWQPVAEATLAAYEAELARPLNATLSRLQAPPVRGFGEIFTATRGVLFAYPELDHYREREPGADYWGVPPAPSGEPVSWPDPPTHKRIFAYLKPFATIEALFEVLAGSGASVLVYAPGLPDDVRARHASPSLSFLDRSADILQVAHECDLAVSHGGIGTVAHVLLAGRPLLLLPLQLEQLLISQRIVELGAGLLTVERSAATLKTMIAALLEDARHREAAEAFARRHPRPNAEAFEAKLHAALDGAGVKPE